EPQLMPTDVRRAGDVVGRAGSTRVALTDKRRPGPVRVGAPDDRPLVGHERRSRLERLRLVEARIGKGHGGQQDVHLTPYVPIDDHPASLKRSSSGPCDGRPTQQGARKRAASDRRRIAMKLRSTGLLVLVAALALAASASAGSGMTQISGSETALPDEVVGNVVYFRSAITADSGSPGLNGQWYQAVWDLGTNTPLIDCKVQSKTGQ